MHGMRDTIGFVEDLVSLPSRRFIHVYPSIIGNVLAQLLGNGSGLVRGQSVATENLQVASGLLEVRILECRDVRRNS